MIDVTNETKNAFLTDSTSKQINIEFDGYTQEDINYFTKIGHHNVFKTSAIFSTDGEQESRFFFKREDENNINGALIRLTECVDHTYYENFKYWYFSLYPKLTKNSEITIEGGTADITISDVSIGLVYYKNRTYTNMYFPIDDSHLDELKNQTYWMKFGVEKFLDTFDDNNKLWELCLRVTIKAENVVLNSGSSAITVWWGGKAEEIMFTLSDVAPENYVYPLFKESPIKNGVYPDLYPNGVDNTDNINYFTGTTKFFSSRSYANISEDRLYDQWDTFYFYPEGSVSHTSELHGNINEERSHQYTNLYISIDAKHVDYEIINGNADVEYTGPLWLSVYYVENGVDKTKYISFTDTNIINEFLSQNGTRIHVALYDFIDARFFDSNNYIKYIRVHFRVKYSNVVINEGHDYITQSYDIVFDNLMINLSNTPSNSFVYPPYTKSQIINGNYPLVNIHNENLMLEDFKLTESICSQDNLKFGLSESANCSFSVADTKDNYINKTFKAYITCENTQKIPLGRFKIQKVSKKTSYNLVTRNITAYDEMMDWTKDATDWYSGYMFGISSTDYSFGGYEFARQMFSTYYNFARYMGYEDDAKYSDELIFESSYLGSTPVASRMYKFVTFTVLDTVSRPPQEIQCSNWGDMQKFEINDISSDYLYKFEKENLSGLSDDYLWNSWFSFMKKDANTKKGILTKGSVMVEEVLDDNTYNRFLVDAGDYFAVSDNCTKLNIYYAIHVQWENAGSSGLTSSFIDKVYLYRTPCPDWIKILVNKSARLVYYDWETLEWNTPTCSVRDIFRSLMEINGAFVKIDRNGDLRCVYSSKGSLYPSETLYPSEDLYPIDNSTIIPKSRYIKCEHEDYESADFGKIQIKSQNANKDVVTLRTYVGNANYDSTYIIDDNVFFCNSAVKFNYRDNVNGQSVTPYDVFPELNVVLGRMFNRISDMGYTPHETELVGMPWMETGDRISLLTNQDAFESFIFRRTLKGIQSLKDTYEAHGDDVIESYKEV